MLRGSRSGFPISGVKESRRPFLSEEFFPMIDKPLFFFCFGAREVMDKCQDKEKNGSVANVSRTNSFQEILHQYFTYLYTIFIRSIVTEFH